MAVQRVRRTGRFGMRSILLCPSEPTTEAPVPEHAEQGRRPIERASQLPLAQAMLLEGLAGTGPSGP